MEPRAEPGWYPDPEGTPGLRWWDGAQWGAQAAGGVGAPPAASPAHGVLPRLKGMRKVHDLHVFPDRVAFAPVKGGDPEVLGALVGFLVLCGLLGAIIGNFVGRAIAKNATTTRLARTAGLPAESLAAYEGAEVVPKEAIASLVAQHHGSGGKIRLQLTDGTTRKYSWAKPHVKDVDVERLLLDVAPGRAEVKPMSTFSKIARVLGIALLVLFGLAIVGGVVAAIMAPEEEPMSSTSSGLPAAVAEPLERACTSWSSLGGAEEPTVEQIRATVTEVRPDFEQVAAGDPSFQAAVDALAFLDSYFAAPTVEQQSQVEAAAADVDAACARS